MINNAIYLRRRQRVFIKRGRAKLESKYPIALLENISSLGYTFSEEVIEVLQSMTVGNIEKVHEEVVNALKEMLGAHVVYRPMYPNFPKQVAEASDDELYTNAMLHYLGDHLGIRILPKYKKKRRPKLKDEISLKIIELGTQNDFETIFTSLASAKSSISENDKEDLKWFVKTYKNDIKALLPEKIPFKENLAFLGSLLDQHTDLAESFLKQHISTATDILRYAVALCGGDVSLAEKTRFRKLSRRQRVLILSLLESCDSPLEDMRRYKEEWKRLGECIHPAEYKKRFPKSYDAFDVIRNKKPFATFNTHVEISLSEKDIEKSLQYLVKRPGELARRLDHLLRECSDPSMVTEAFGEIAHRVSTPVLLQVLTHFKYRNRNKDLRVFFPKGNVSKVNAIKNELPKIHEDARQGIVSICKEALRAQFGDKKPLGKVYLDKSLKNYTVPFSLRSASKSLKTVGRGSKWEISPDVKTLRFFIWWKDGRERTDIDLSAAALDKDHKFKTTIAYYNLSELGGHHSGDITSAPNGASEFIDIDIDEFLKKGTRYVLMSINSFTQQPFCDLPECFAGFMPRKKPNSGEIYDPRTVDSKIDVTSDTRVCIPLIIDLEERKVVWTDIALNNNPRTNNNVYENMSSISLMSKAMMSMVKPTLFELLQIHAEARGEIVQRKKDADIVFSEKEGITPFHSESIIADFL